jgi:hypothetical protein
MTSTRLKFDDKNGLTGNILELLESGSIEQGEFLEYIEYCAYKAVMEYTRVNQVHAAKVLGVSRGTLRAKLIHYFGTTIVGRLWHNDKKINECHEKVKTKMKKMRKFHVS